MSEQNALRAPRRWSQPRWVIALLLVAATMVGAVVALVASRRLAPPAAPLASTAAETPTRYECDEREASCERFGQPGECVRGRCVLGEGSCSQDVDCDDDNVCTVDRCDEGRCVQLDGQGICKLASGGAGTCQAGHCEFADAAVCDSDRDCPTSSNACAAQRCQSGVCMREVATDGASCRSAAGQPGTCEAARCISTGEQGQTRCKVLYDRWYGAYRRCSAGLRYSLSQEQIRETERKISERLAKSYRYDIKTALIELPDGGYNISLHNRRTSAELSGLCDPSFVAWSVADFTANTNWRSRALHIWLRSYAEGWGISTAGGREAVRAARARSSLGWAGVVDAPALRQWLEKGFRSLPAAPVASLGGIK